MPAERALIYEFVSEAKEHLANVADDLLALEQRRDDAPRYRIDRLFRAVHSVKGAAGFFGCQTVESLAHALEAILEDARDRDDPPSAAVIDALLAGSDRILALLDDVEHSNEADVADLLARLRALLPAGPVAGAPGLCPIAGAPGLSVLAAPPMPLMTQAAPLAERPAGHAYLYGLEIDLPECQCGGLGPLAVLRRLQEVGSLLDGCLDVTGTDLEAGLPAGPVTYRAVVSATLAPDDFARALDLPGARVMSLESPPAPATRPPPAEEKVPVAPATERRDTLRIPVGLVDRLMTLAGELVLVRNQSVRAIDPRDAALRPVVQRLDAVTGELQDAVLRTRMQPVGNLFGKFPRMVRDLARQLGKEIELDLAGTDVELDKTILEALSDPLTHLVRNCCDHGIEAPDRRRRDGKPPQGHVWLSARHLGGQILLVIRDDGRGIDPEAIRRKAIQQGLRPPAELGRMGEREVLNLILLPGFSTAAEVTELSGRGVGMDVVKTNLDRLGGVLEIDSEPGRGTTFTLRLPLTLAIIPCLIVAADGQRYAIPQKDLEELVCVQPGQSRCRVEHAFDREVVRLRDRLLPLVRLSEVLRRPAPFTPATWAEVLRANRGRAAGMLYFAVAKVGSRRFGLVVDDILNTEEVVVKPLHAALKPLACFAGATIRGDGRVALILSMEGVARHAGVRFDDVKEPAAADGDGRGPETQAMLLFKSGPREQFAVPLALVRRIEMVSPGRIERVGEQEFLTVEGVPTPVLRLDRFLPVSPCADREVMFLLLPKNPPRPLGVLLSAVVDTVHLPVELHRDAVAGDGLLGSAVVRGQLTLFPDLGRLAERMAPAASRPRREALPGRRRRVLLVEDTQFFRQVVRGYLEDEGFEVVTADNGALGLQHLDEGPFDLVVSDIEMPVMDGWAFARAVRERPDGGRLPLLALTTLSADADRARALACGFDRHETKLDRERFLAAVAELLAVSPPRRAPG
jgi:two-component system chemotaxis sensor kinase CheA